MLIPIILSGGAGTRLWPLSWGDHPKQFLPLVSEKTMIQETLLRLTGLELGTPIVSCNESHRFLVAQQLSEIGIKPKILLEPVAKNTAPAIACACCAAMNQSKDAVVVVLPSDHVIENTEVFQKALQIAAKEAENGSLVTFGIVPTYPATGYGYVKSGEADSSEKVYKLEKFVEKPCLEMAQEYIASGEYDWNSGMFVFKASVFLEELKTFNPQMYDLATKAFENAEIDSDFIRLDKSKFEQITGDSIDYAVMEKTAKGKIVKLNAGWNDVGSWAALYDISKKDENQNVINGDVIALDTISSYVHGGNRTVATIGLKNIVVVDSEDSLLIADISKIQDVKKIAEVMKQRK